MLPIKRYLKNEAPGSPLRSWQPWLVVGLVVAAGYLVLRAMAAGPAAVYLVPGGTLANGASVAGNAAAIGGQMVVFGPAATPTPAPTPTPTPAPTPTPGSGKPDATNTGIPAGTALTVVSGNQTYGPSANGQTIIGKDFHGYVNVTGSNITFKNCFFHGGTPNGNAALLDTQEGSGTGIVVQDSEFFPLTQNATIDGVWGQNLTLLRVNIHGTTDGIKASSGTVIQDSYIHDLKYFAVDPNQTDGTHNDAIQILDGTGIRAVHNTLSPNDANANSAVQITQDFGTVGTVLLDQNWVDWGGCTLNITQKPGSTLNGISVTNNRFGRNQQFSGCTVLIGTGVTLAAYSGNVWDNNGTAVPAVQQHN
jgi:hypothetical protein